jgi:hypothetical protein
VVQFEAFVFMRSQALICATDVEASSRWSRRWWFEVDDFDVASQTRWAGSLAELGTHRRSPCRRAVVFDLDSSVAVDGFDVIGGR